MSDKEQSPSQPQQILTGYYPMYPEPKNDEIDLFELIAQLWRKKWWIVGCMFLTTSIAGIYAFTAKEQWTATAVIDAPTFDTIDNYYRGVRLVEGNVDKPISSEEVSTKLFQQFVNLSSSYNEISQFVGETTYFKRLSQGMGEAEKSRLLSDLVGDIKFSKERDSVFYTISFPADTAVEAKKLLTDYMKKVNENVSKIQYSQLQSQIKNKRETIKNQMEAMKKIAEEQRLEEVENIKMALSIAEKANIIKPEVTGLSKIDNTNMFLLGKDALLAMADNIQKQPLVLSDIYYDYQRQYINLSNFKVTNSTAQSFSYLKNPLEPVNKDKPKKLLILIIGLLAGAVLGSVIVLTNSMVSDYKRKYKLSN